MDVPGHQPQLPQCPPRLPPVVGVVVQLVRHLPRLTLRHRLKDVETHLLRHLLPQAQLLHNRWVWYTCAASDSKRGLLSMKSRCLHAKWGVFAKIIMMIVSGELVLGVCLDMP